MLGKYADCKIVVLDKLTYAGNLDNLKDEIEAHAFDINTKVIPQLRVAIKDGKRIIDVGDEVGQANGDIQERKRLGGMLRYYYRKAA